MKRKLFRFSYYEVGKIERVLCLLCLFLLSGKELWGFSFSTVLELSKIGKPVCFFFFLFVWVIR
jgi:hypothetical protein